MKPVYTILACAAALLVAAVVTLCTSCGAGVSVTLDPIGNFSVSGTLPPPKPKPEAEVVPERPLEDK